jgi:pyridoxine kinase
MHSLLYYFNIFPTSDVGNKAAVFPLQLLGFDVDVINSVQFSNHTGYGSWEGEVLQGDMLLKLVDGMNENGLLSDETGHILTGYIGSESFLRAVVTVVRRMKAVNPQVRYVCDPVLGDIGRFYVPQQLVKIYRDEVIPLANVLTPNQFEVEQLTGVRIENIADAQRACGILHDLGVPLVLITSIVFPTNAQQSHDSLGMFASERLYGVETESHEDDQRILFIPKLPGQFTGTGDVCAALWLALTANRSTSLSRKLEQLAGTMNAIVERTHQASLAKLHKQGISSLEEPKDEATRKKIVLSREMQLIQSAGDILNPPLRFQAERISIR